ncbi:hypothetical protein BRAO285_500040 [Bradyrhizobium sp. ORS 285]|nr:hypothetical protein BRAO285_500040 [Bradyrhizobium sp. ORS 285]
MRDKLARRVVAAYGTCNVPARQMIGQSVGDTQHVDTARGLAALLLSMNMLLTAICRADSGAGPGW